MVGSSNIKATWLGPLLPSKADHYVFIRGATVCLTRNVQASAKCSRSQGTQIRKMRRAHQPETTRWHVVLPLKQRPVPAFAWRCPARCLQVGPLGRSITRRYRPGQRAPDRLEPPCSSSSPSSPVEPSRRAPHGRRHEVRRAAAPGVARADGAGTDVRRGGVSDGARWGSAVRGLVGWVGGVR